MDPRKLVIVLEVAEQGSVSRAAQSLNVAQPSLSRTISDFEASIGIRIFDRGTRGVTLTQDGERLITHARAIRAELHHAQQEIVDAKAEEETPIAIGIVTVHPIDQLMEAMLALIALRPRIRIRCDSGTRDQLLKPLIQGELDLVLGPLPPEPLGQGYAEDIIYYEELAIYCGRPHRLFGCKSTSLEELVDMNWVLGGKGSTSRRRVEAFFRSQGIEPPRVDIEFEEIPARRSMVLQSDYLSVFQRHHVLKEINADRIFPLPIPWGQDDRPIGVIRLAGIPLSPAAADFIGTLRNAFSKAGIRTVGSPGSPRI